LTPKQNDPVIAGTLRLEFSMSSYLIIGSGHFGRQAVLRLLQKDLHAVVTAVDRTKSRLQEISQLPIKTVVCDGQSFLRQFLLNREPIDYIIPAVPYHLAFEYILSCLNPLGAKRTEIPPLQGLPNPMRGKTGDLYTSLADFLCPDNCPEPSQYCTVTGKKRSEPLFEILSGLKEPLDSNVIRSRQLGLGVGGFRPEALVNLIERIKKRRGSNRPFLISTACRCHGVTSALSF
jgi:hypothetical protein